MEKVRIDNETQGIFARVRASSHPPVAVAQTFLHPKLLDCALLSGVKVLAGTRTVAHHPSGSSRWGGGC